MTAIEAYRQLASHDALIELLLPFYDREQPAMTFEEMKPIEDAIQKWILLRTNRKIAEAAKRLSGDS